MPSSLRHALLPLSILAVLAGCIFETATPPSVTAGRGSAEVRVKLERVGALGKRGAASAIEMKQLIVRLSAEGEAERMDTLGLSGEGEILLNKTYGDLAAGKEWILAASSRDARGLVIHSGTRSFQVEPGRTTTVSLDLASFYSVLTAWFHPIDDSVSKVELRVDGEIARDSAFPAQAKVGDTVKLTHDYLAVGARRIAMNVYGTYEGVFRLLYSGDTLIQVAPGAILSYRIPLSWKGPKVVKGKAAMQVVLGAIGRVDVHGEINTSKNFPPVFAAAPAGVAYPGIEYRDSVAAYDPDGDSLAYALLSGPAGMVLNGSILTWTPGAEDAQVSVQADDGRGGRDTVKWNIALARSVLSGILAKDTVLAAAMSPYWVTGNVLLKEGFTLTIEPGVVLKMGEGRGIQINGKLIAQGTAADSIVFEPALPGKRWGRLLFADTAVDATFDAEGVPTGGSVLGYCRLSEGGAGAEAMLYSHAGLHIHHSAFLGSESRGMTVLGRSRIADSRILRNQGGGLTYMNKVEARGRILRNRVDSNGTSANYTGSGAYIGGAAILDSNVFAGNGHPSLNYTFYIDRAWGFSNGTTLSGNRFEGNAANERFLYFDGGPDSLIGNVFAGNSSAGDLVWLSGTHAEGNRFEGNSAGPQHAIVRNSLGNFLRNTLVGNTGALYGLSVYGGVKVTGNNFLDAGIVTRLSNENQSTSPALDATGNYWGTASAASVEALIRDWIDDANRGLVEYAPFLASPASGAPAP